SEGSHVPGGGFAHELVCLACHPERSEGSPWSGTEILRGVSPERSEGLRMTGPVVIVKHHHRLWFSSTHFPHEPEAHAPHHILNNVLYCVANARRAFATQYNFSRGEATRTPGARK